MNDQSGNFFLEYLMFIECLICPWYFAKGFNIYIKYDNILFKNIIYFILYIYKISFKLHNNFGV